MRDSFGALLAVWLTVLVIAAAVLAATGYRTGDADSRAYIAITTHLVDEPVARWIAPQWWGAFGLQGLFRDHPAGTFVPPALLAKAGYLSANRCLSSRSRARLARCCWCRRLRRD